jgi:hypothetical protein
MHQHDLFVSYSSADSAFVDRLVADLKAYGISVWLDRWEIAAGDRIRDRINRGIHGSHYVLCVLSQHALNSPWVQAELDSAMIRELETRQIIVIPILIDNVAHDELPADLRGKLYLDFRSPDKYSENLDAIRSRFSRRGYDYHVPLGFNLIDIREGARVAKIRRKKLVVAQSEGLSAVYDEIYSAGRIKDISVWPGSVLETSDYGGRVHVATRLPRPLGIGERSNQTIEWLTLDSMLEREESFTNWIINPTFRFKYAIIFPRTRTPTSYKFEVIKGGEPRVVAGALRKRRLLGRTVLSATRDFDSPNENHKISWIW